MKHQTANRSQLVTGRILAHGEAMPDKTALIVGNRVISYGFLLAQAEKMASTLSSAAPAPRVGILTTDPLQLLAGFLATGLSEGTAVVYDPAWTRRQQCSAMEQVGVDTFVTEPSGRRRLEQIAQLPKPTSNGRYARGAVAPKGTLADFYVGFTSGTSGTPKAFSRSHASWLASFHVAQQQFDLCKSDRVLVPGALHHSLFLFAALQSLWMGATACVLRRFNPSGLVRAVERSPITRVWAVPTMLAAAEPRLRTVEEDSLLSVRGVYCSGSAWAPDQRRRCSGTFPRAEVVEFYGSSELSFVAFASSRDEAVEPGYLRPFPGVDLSIRPEDPPRPGAGGLIYVRSPLLFSGYHSPEPAGFAQDGQGWITVGDIGHLNTEGALKVTGRATSTLICGGQNLQPEPIEHCLEQVEEVADAAVVGIPDPLWGQKPVALVRWRAGSQPLARSALASHCRRELGPGARPHDFKQVSSLPRTPSGKVARGELEHQLATGAIPAQAIT
ncbi:MAG: AMP-binding protein [Actinobacteria bacterium]|nr:AMP-binding protein [Actinomycetota bacterium]